MQFKYFPLLIVMYKRKNNILGFGYTRNSKECVNEKPMSI